MNRRTVVLTFDDAVTSHLANVAPLLKEYGFGATFFICRFSEEWRAAHSSALMTAKQIAELSRMGFEIGNHTWSHPDLRKLDEDQIAGEIQKLNDFLANAGIPKPLSFAYPGGPYVENAAGILKRMGFHAARTTEQRTFNRSKEDPMRLPAIPIQGDDPSLFRNAVARATETDAVVLVFHGVPEYVHPWVHTDFERFKEYMAYLKENAFRVVSLQDALEG